jgi:hypothetical protein
MIKDNTNEESLTKQIHSHRLEYNDVHHFNEVIKEILANKKKTGLDEFEEISMLTKEKMTKLSFQYVLPQFKPCKSIELTAHEEKILTELNKKKPKEVPLINHYIEDVLLLSRMLEWAGISFGKNEWFKIRLAMKKLMVESDAVSLRFWGKIYGTTADYYIIQGSLRHYPLQDPKLPYKDVRGNEGLNRYVYWVSNSILEGWYELPEVTAEQIMASRNFKYHFTGDLNAKVKGFNNFPGRESHLLKCQVLRIMHSSSIVPDGYLRASDKYQEDLAGKITEVNTDDYQPGAFEDMKTDDKWVHEYAYIYPNGKIIDPSIQEQVERMKKISDEVYQKMDKEGNPIDIKFWRVKVIGDQMQYTKDNNTSVYATVVLTNTRWPGSTCVWKVIYKKIYK